MTSYAAEYKKTPSNTMYINVAGIQSTIVDENLNPVSWVLQVPAVSIPGAVVLRDMGKTIYVPDLASGANVSTILRKVQLVPAGALGVYGTGAGTGNAAPGGPQEYYTGYIRLGGSTYGDGDGLATAVARIQ
jgi:hypothetical protein